MNKLVYFTVAALFVLAGCSKSDPIAEQADTRTKGKVIVRYLEVVDLTEPIEVPDGMIFPEITCSEQDVVIPAAGGSKTITTSLFFRGQCDLLPEFTSDGEWVDRRTQPLTQFQLLIDDVDQHLHTEAQSADVEITTYPLHHDSFSKVRVPTGRLRKVLYSDNTTGFIPDSTSTPAYAIEGTGCIGVADFMEVAPYLVTDIKGPWFSISTNALEPYARIDLSFDYFAGKPSLEERTEYTHFGDVQQAFLNANTSYLYLKSLAPENLSGSTFTIKVAPNTTGKSRTFTLGFPINLLWGDYYIYYTVTQL